MLPQERIRIKEARELDAAIKTLDRVLAGEIDLLEFGRQDLTLNQYVLALPRAEIDEIRGILNAALYACRLRLAGRLKSIQ